MPKTNQGPELTASAMNRQQTVLVLGAYGLIGQEVSRLALRKGLHLIGLGREPGLGSRLLPNATWIEADMRDLKSADSWRPLIGGCNAVVNAAGVLQNGAGDDAQAVHQIAVTALIGACEQLSIERFVQISVPAITTGAPTSFSQTKLAADNALKASSLNWTILRPGLVIGRGAYGGSALLRMLAGFPFVQPILGPELKIQTVALAEVAQTAVDACMGHIPAKSDLDLVEPSTHNLLSVVLAIRQWLGYPVPLGCIRVPRLVGKTLAKAGDVLGRLGWRPPLRTTTLTVLNEGITGDDSAVRALTGRPLMSLEETLNSMPATVQERWFARLYLVLPAIIGVLAVFWTLSGVIGLISLDTAVGIIADQIGASAARTAVVGGSIIDIALGMAILYRPWARYACWGMVGVTLAYVVAGSTLLPHLWLDPLGPLAKAIPAMMLALLAPILLEDR